MRVIGAEPGMELAVLVDMELRVNGVSMGCVVIGQRVSPLLPLASFATGGDYTGRVADPEAVLRQVREADPQMGVTF